MQRGKKYSGDIYAKKYGSDDGFTLMGNITELTTKQEVDKDELLGTGRDNYGQAIESQIKPKPTQIELKFNTFDKEAFARVLMGQAVDFTKQVQTFNDKTAKVQKGQWVKLEYDDIDPKGFSVKNKTSQAIATEHYVLNERLGMIKFLETAEVTNGDNFTYSGKTKGTAGYVIEAGTLTDIHLEMYLDGFDRISEKNGILTIPHAVLSAEGDINWFDDKWWESGLSGTLIKDSGKAVMTFKEFTD